jgi:hypothetical protein
MCPAEERGGGPTEINVSCKERGGGPGRLGACNAIGMHSFSCTLWCPPYLYEATIGACLISLHLDHLPYEPLDELRVFGVLHVRPRNVDRLGQRMHRQSLEEGLGEATAEGLGVIEPVGHREEWRGSGVAPMACMEALSDLEDPGHASSYMEWRRGGEDQ